MVECEAHHMTHLSLQDGLLIMGIGLQYNVYQMDDTFSTWIVGERCPDG